MENKKLDEFKKNIKGKKIAVLGLGVSNIPAIKYLYSLGAIIYAHDENENLSNEALELKKLDGIYFCIGKEALKNLNDMDYILRSPGIKPFKKEIEEALKSGVTLTSEIELLVELAPCKIIGITGSAGKTTTTTLVSTFLKDAGYNVWLGGNIGIPLFSNIDNMKKDDIIVLELSSFQLMTMHKSPNISLITNIYEDHLDYHRSFDEYVDAKTNIFMHQKIGDICVLNKDDSFTCDFVKRINDSNIESKIRYFSVKEKVNDGAYYKDENIILCRGGMEDIIVFTKNIKLKGIKNYANICSAISLVYDYVSIESMKKTLLSFNGVEHRLEYVDTKNGVSYYNDSISTTPGKAMAALSSFDKKIILIAGGYDKNLDYSDIGDYIIDSAKCLILLGDTKDKIKESVCNSKKYDENKIDIYEVSNMDQAVEKASSYAKDGDIVVMSPASASFDMYSSYKERGKHFKELVSKI